MKPLRTLRWVIPATFAVILSAASAYFYAGYTARWAVVQSWLDARPGMTQVDLSRPGSVTAPLPQDLAISHHGLSFVPDLGESSVPRGPDLFKGLRGEIRIRDDQGREVGLVSFDEGLDVGSDGPNRCLLGITFPLPQGMYSMSVEVVSGAPGLAGVEQMVYARHVICPLEALPATFRLLLALMAGIPAVILWLLVAVRVAWPATRPRTPYVEDPAPVVPPSTHLSRP